MSQDTMSQITKPLMLDETGQAIVEAIKGLNLSSSGSSSSDASELINEHNESEDAHAALFEKRVPVKEVTSFSLYGQTPNGTHMFDFGHEATALSVMYRDSKGRSSIADPLPTNQQGVANVGTVQRMIDETPDASQQVERGFMTKEQLLLLNDLLVRVATLEGDTSGITGKIFMHGNLDGDGEWDGTSGIAVMLGYLYFIIGKEEIEVDEEFLRNECEYQALDDNDDGCGVYVYTYTGELTIRVDSDCCYAIDGSIVHEGFEESYTAPTEVIITAEG